MEFEMGVRTTIARAIQRTSQIRRPISTTGLAVPSGVAVSDGSGVCVRRTSVPTTARLVGLISLNLRWVVGPPSQGLSNARLGSDFPCLQLV